MAHWIKRSGAAQIAAFGILLATSAPLLTVITEVAANPTHSRFDFRLLLERPFLGAVQRSLKLAGLIALVSFPVGWLFGTLCRLLPRFITRISLAVVAVPLVIPSFFWAVGISNLRPLLAYRHQWLVDGFAGSVFALIPTGVALVGFVSYAAATRATGSCIEAARLYGGERCALRTLLSFTSRSALAAAIFGASLAISDVGCSQVMGYHGVASEILIDLASRNDIRSAMIQSLAVAVVSLPFVTLAAFGLVSVLQTSHDTAGVERSSDGRTGRCSQFWAITLFGLVGILVLLPLFGIIRPLLQPYSHRSIANAFSLWKSSMFTAIGCALTAAGVAVLIALGLCTAAKNSLRTYRVTLIWSLIIIGLPSSLHSLGIVFAASSTRGMLQSWLRSGWMVGAGLGIRLFPIAFAIVAVSWVRLPKMYGEAAAIHGLGTSQYLGRIIAPLIAPAIVAAAAVTFLLSLTDTSSLMLLQPPGWNSYPTQIFGMLDNSAETKLAALGLVYLLFPAILLALLIALQLVSRIAVMLQSRLMA